MDDRRYADGPGLTGHAQRVVDQCRLATPIDGPADHLAAEGVEHDAAVDLALPGRVLGDVGEPQDVRTVDGEVALDQVLFGSHVHEVLRAPFRTRQALDPELTHDGEDQLLVDDHVPLAHEGRSDPQHSVGAPGSRMDVGDQILQQQPADLALRGQAVLVLVEARS